tara:strand:+ start:2909 stop:3103 length:195 start_codon:yes stop_codon:yes gene_type:complete
MLNKFLGWFGIVTVNHMESRILHFRKCDSVAMMEWMDELDDRFSDIESRIKTVHPKQLQPKATS